MFERNQMLGILQNVFKINNNITISILYIQKVIKKKTNYFLKTINNVHSFDIFLKIE